MGKKNLSKLKQRLIEGEKNDKKTERWGLVKFKPTANEPTHKNPFNQPQQFNRFNDDDGNRKHDKFKKGKDKKERIRFNPIARDARPENATPWKKFKDDITYKQLEEEQANKQANIDTEEGRQMLKQREINYRKMLMEQKKQEPTTWEDFGEDNGSKKNQGDGKKDKKRKNKTRQSVPEAQDVGKNQDQLKDAPKKKNKIKNDQTSKIDVQNSDNRKEFISKDVLENFDSSKLNFHQKDKIRSILTKSICLGKTTLKQCVENRKHQFKKNKKRQLK